MSENVGYATLSVIPSARGIGRRLRQQTDSEIAKAGKAASRTWAENFTRDRNGRLRDSRGKFVSRSRALGEDAGDAAEQGFEDGFSPTPRRWARSFARNFKATIREDFSGDRGLFTNVFRAIRGAARQTFTSVAKLGDAMGAFGKVAKSAFTSFQGPVANVIKLLGALLVALTLPVTGLTALVGVSGLVFGAMQTGAAGAVAAMAALGVAAAAQSQRVKSAFRGLGKEIKQGVMDAVQPLVPVVAESAGKIRRIFTEDLQPALTGVFKDLAPVVSDFFDNFLSSLRPVVSQLRPFINDLLPSFEAAGRSLEPIMRGLAQFMSRIGDAIRETAPQFETFLRTVGKLFDPLGRLFASMIRIGSNALPTMTDALVKATGGLANFVVSVEKFIKKANLGALFNAGARSVKNFVLAFVTGLTGGKFQAGKNAVNSLAAAVKDFTRWLNKPETQQAIKRFGRDLGNFFRNLPKHIAKMRQFIADAQGFITRLQTVFGRVKFAITHPFQAAGNLVRLILTNMITTAVSTAGRVVNAFLSMGSRIVGATRSGFSRSVAAARAQAGRLLGLVRSLPGRIRRALGNMGSLLYWAGRSMITGMVRGILSGAGWVVRAARNIAYRAIRAARRALSSNSPSRVFMSIGRDVTDGFSIGISRGTRDVEAAISRMTRARPDMASPFAGVDPGSSAAPLAREIADAVSGLTVAMDGETVGRLVSERIGKQTSLRLRAG